MSEPIELFHYVDFDRSSKVRWALHELGLAYVDRSVDPEKRLEPPFTDVNPFSLVPTIRRDGVVHQDAGAIVMSLADEHPEADLIPTDPAERARCIEWCWFAGSTLEGALFGLFNLQEAAPGSETTAGAQARLDRFLGLVEERVAGRGSILDTFSAADILLAYPLKNAIRGRRDEFPGIAGYLDALAERPQSRDARFWAEPPGA